MVVLASVKARQQHLALVRFAIAIRVREEHQIRRLRHHDLIPKNAEPQRRGELFLLHKHRRFIRPPRALCVF